MSTPQFPESDQGRLEEEIFQALRVSADVELRGLAKLLAAMPERQFFGRNEFTVRDRALRIGSQALAVALAARKRGATKARV